MSSSKTIELETGDNLEYKFFPISSNIFEFCVRARNDAHIILTSSASVHDTIYEVIIGGWKNTKTVIRKNDTKSKMSEFTSDILSAYEFRKFTVEWKRKQILVHYKGDTLIFFYLKNSQGLDKISHVGVATGWGATGSWIITEAGRQTSGDQGSLARRDTDESSKNKKYSWSNAYELETGDNLEYKFFPISSNIFEFCVRARNDAHIILTSSASVHDTIYEVIIGGRKNTKTVIHKNDTKSKMSEFTPDILSAYEFRKFTVEWKRKQILVHYKGDTLIFFYLKDSQGLDKISHVGVATGWGATGSWIITEAGRQTSGDQGSLARRDTDESSKNKKYSWSNAYGLETRDNTHYCYYPNSSGCLNFRVKAKSHVHVLLSSRSFLQHPFYEVIFNENGNSKVVLRQDRSLPNLAEVIGCTSVTADNYRGYRIRWLGEKITVGHERDSTPFLSWTKNQYVPIDYVAFHAGNGSTGSWIIKRTPEPGGNGYWVRASNGEVPPLAYIGGFDVETDLYIARARFRGQLIPGMVREGSKTCSVVLGWEYQVSEYEVLCECRGRWFYTNKTYIPSTAIRAGRDANGTPIYVGKINRKKGVILGKVHNSICFVSINGKETQYTEFYILVSPEGA